MKPENVSVDTVDGEDGILFVNEYAVLHRPYRQRRFRVSSE